MELEPPDTHTRPSFINTATDWYPRGIFIGDSNTLNCPVDGDQISAKYTLSRLVYANALLVWPPMTTTSPLANTTLLWKQRWKNMSPVRWAVASAALMSIV
jgi:hypothetical protein